MDKDRIKILLVEDSPSDQMQIRDMLNGMRDAEFECTITDRLSRAKAYLEQADVDIVLLDLGLPDNSGLDALTEIAAAAADIPVVVLTVMQGEARAMQALRRGAEDYLLKDLVHPEMLKRVVRYTVKRRRFRQALFSSEARFQKIITRNADAIVIVNDEGSIRYANPAATKLFGLPYNQLVGTHFGRPLIQDDCTEIDIISNTDQKIVAEMCSVRIEWEGEEVLLASLRDTTARKQAEERLRQYKRIVASSSDFMSLIDRRYAYQAINEAYLQAFNKSRAEMLGLTVADVVGPDIFEKEIKPKLDRCFGGQKVNHQMWLPLPSRGRRYLDIHYYPYADEGQTIAGVVVNARDITDKKQLEDQLQFAQRMKAIATLAGGIAHEFNNALASIIGNIDLLRWSKKLDEDLRQHTTAALAAAERMRILTAQLLAYAQGGKYTTRRLSISDLIDQSLPLFKHTLEPGIQIETELIPDLPPIQVDETQMQMVFSALLSNAADAIDARGHIRIRTGRLEVEDRFRRRVSDRKPGRYVYFTVEDNGRGMDGNTKNRIFEPFFTTKFQGRGLGMAAVYGIVKNHHGWIKVESALNRGTRVSIYLPVPEDCPPAAEHQALECQPEQTAVLFIDDEKAVRNVGRSMLEHLGYYALEAENTEAALEIVASFDGDIKLAIIDVGLIGEKGQSLPVTLLTANSPIKIILTSGTRQDTVPAALQELHLPFLAKPFSLQSLKAKLEKVLRA